MSGRAGLAQYLESLEVAVSETCIGDLQTGNSGCDAVARRIAGGGAFFFGPMSPLSQAIGVGMQGPVSSDDFSELEGFFLSRGAPVAISLCPLADPSVLARLAERRYRITQFEHTLIRDLHAGELATVPSRDLVRPASKEESKLWVRTAMEGFQEESGDFEGMRDLFEVLFAARDTTAYLGWQDGRAVACGAVAIGHLEAALFFSDTTLCGYRRRGIQSSLIAARLAQAIAAGCKLAVASTSPGSSSQRNYERAGFRVAYTKAILTSP